ncbi:hypothetical protein [Nocardioides insulae]|uniref:hypothetical protein n=1 Tax=Nocardioides insulae TaxID=394734 RepID=UPI000424539A|nr:hypothetical protein [Nocardioides insulae]
MTATAYIVWFIATAIMLVALLSIGMAGSSGVLSRAAREERKQARQIRRRSRPLSSGRRHGHVLTWHGSH